jgi:hypothetical protein
MAYLTKSLFNIGRECATRLYYAKKREYPSVKDDDDFLKSLAEGGMQVGELACLYHPGGHPIETLRSEDAIAETERYLRQDSVTLYEPAIVHDGRFLIRVDVFEKVGNHVDLIEVKAKSVDSGTDFYSRDGSIKADWLPYLMDVAFQYWVMSRAHPEWTVTPWLMLVDKDATATVDGLYQRFRVVENAEGRKQVVLKPGTESADLGGHILTKINVMEPVRMILDGRAVPEMKQTALQRLGFGEWVRTMADYFLRDERYPVEIGKHCKTCEFNVPTDRLEPGQKSGFHSCWEHALGWRDEDFADPHVFDIWNARGLTDRMLDAGKYKIQDMESGDLPAHPDGLTTKTGPWDNKERQTVQILMASGGIGESNVILNGLHGEMQHWNYPVHFLDFEALRTAIPFSAGNRPYQQYAFQFSVHTMHQDGTVVHSGEWIHRERGTFPNFECIRELKKVLGDDGTTVFQYTHFEHTLLRQVADELRAARERVDGADGLRAARQHVDDADELIAWIETLLEGGPRALVDLKKLIQQYHYDAGFGGSISIKKVLPAILSGSAFLKEKYSRPYTGKNFVNQIWYREDADGHATDPYKLLGPLSIDGEEIMDSEDGEGSGGDPIAGGGEAMMAWARMQFDDIPDAERDSVFTALLKYCELDTLAMVMVVESWRAEFG